MSRASHGGLVAAYNYDDCLVAHDELPMVEVPIIPWEILGVLGWSLLTPVVAYRDKIHKRTGIEVVFTQSIIEYRINREMCVCRLNTSLSRDSNQGLRYE